MVLRDKKPFRYASFFFRLFFFPSSSISIGRAGSSYSPAKEANGVHRNGHIYQHTHMTHTPIGGHPKLREERETEFQDGDWRDLLEALFFSVFRHNAQHTNTHAHKNLYTHHITHTWNCLYISSY